MFIIYHNTRCGTSRKVLSILEKSSTPFEIIDYLKTPLSEEELRELLSVMKVKPIDIIRKKESLFEEKYKEKRIAPAQWIKILAKNPVLIERPIIRAAGWATLVRGREQEEALYQKLYPRLGQLYQFLAMNNKDAFTLYSIGYEYTRLEDWEKSVFYFEKLRETHPDYVGVYYHLGKCYERLSKPEIGMEIYEAGIAAAQAKGDLHALSELKNRIQNRKMGIFEDE